jgi:DNA topoisomerase-1
MTVAVGRFGPYIRHDGKFYSLSKADDPLEITAERAVEIIEAKREADKNKVINIFGENGEIQVLNGRFGPYIAFEKNNYKIPKKTDATTLTEEQCRELIAQQADTVGKKKKPFGRGRKKA